MTQFTPPTLSNKLVARPGLAAALAADSLPKLALVSAPAGYGKTTLLIQWHEKLKNAGMLTPWVSLRKLDGDLLHLLQAITDSIQHCDNSCCIRTAQLFRGVTRVDIDTALSEIIADLEEIRHHMVLFLDDYHRASEPATDEFIELLLDLMPGNFSLVLACRTLPSIGVSALKVKGEVLEINAEKLRFSFQESHDFFHKVHNLELDEEQTVRIYEHSEGWVAGLQLASLALREPGTGPSFIDSFSGRLHDIADYLASEVLNQQPDSLQDFLLRSSLTERTCADLAVHLTGESNAQNFLETAAKEGLFLVSLDPENNWYRYQHLFQEFLQEQLHKKNPEEIPGLYSRASVWFEKNGLIAEAADYARKAGESTRLAELVDRQGRIELKAGRMPWIITWVNRIPIDVLHNSPPLLYLLGTALYHSNRAKDASKVLEILIARIDSLRNELEPEVLELYEEKISVLQAGVAMSNNDIHLVIPALSRPLTHLSDFEMGIAFNIRGYAHAELSEFDQAVQFLTEARRHHQMAQAEFGMIYSDCFLALVDYAKGNLDQCYARLALGDPESDGSSEKYVVPVREIIEGLVLYQWNRIEEAFELISPNLKLIREVGHIKLLALGYITLARISALRGDYRAAIRFYEQIKAISAVRGVTDPHFNSLVECDLIAFLLQSQRLNEAIDAALEWGVDVDATTIHLGNTWKPHQCIEAFIWARIQIATGRGQLALDVLNQLAELAANVRERRHLVEAYLLTGIIQFDGDRQQGAELIRKAIELSANNNALRAFLDEGEQLQSILAELSRAPLLNWKSGSRDFLASISPQGQDSGSSPHGYPDNQRAELIEPMSDREIEVLQQIASGCTNSLIASNLLISENTVKWHLKNIFLKLGVTNRTSAVREAQQLHLLDD